jgi:hypothetical protein
VELDPDRPIVPDPIPHAIAWAERLRTIAARLDARPHMQKSAQIVHRMAGALETAVERHRSGTLSPEADARLRELLDRLNESTWNGHTTQTKNDIMRQASYGVFPSAADLLVRALVESARRADAERHPSLRPDRGAIDLSGATDLDDR